MEQLKTSEMKTPLYERHCALGAKIVPFSGWLMPIQYKGIIHEHQAVRKHAGLFDVSHMGRILVSGKEAEQFLDFLSTNKISDKPDLSATYTVWPNDAGGSVDDVIIYREDAHHFFIIVNAGNRQKDLDHLTREALRFDVQITPCFDSEGILALQGPKALAILQEIIPDAVKVKLMRFVKTQYKGHPLILSGTGYTGAGGCEIYGYHADIIALWDLLIEKGVEPIGLGARDTLRLEMGYALYGHELADDIAATESVSSWTVRWEKPSFIGREPLRQLEANPAKRVAYGVVLKEPGIAREGYPVFQGDHQIGKVTSGTMSPSLNKAIALILVDKILKTGDSVEIQIRQSRVKAEVIQLPFYQAEEHSS